MDRIDLPPNEARRVTVSVKIALQLAAEAIAAVDEEKLPARLAAVFACSGGNSEALAKVLGSLSEGVVSPNQFAHLGHNAASGYWSLIQGRPAPTTSLGAFDGSFAAGLIEAASQVVTDGCSVLFVSCDVPPPAALHDCRPVTTVFGASLILTPPPPQGVDGAWLDLQLVSGEREDQLTDPVLEALRRDNPAARGLPLFLLSAQRKAGRVVLPLVANRRLAAEYAPC
ncbi:MAG: beta-ketoacyl synthase chain length factor [Rhodospirillales bacterium]